MQIPETVQALVDAELSHLAKTEKYSIPAQNRLAIYAAIGPASVTDQKVLYKAINHNERITLSVPDRVRARITLAAARKVEPLWEAACRESDGVDDSQREPSAAELEEERQYAAGRKQKPIEQISVFDVPRARIPSHILEMAELALRGEIKDYAAFAHETNEWWGIYSTDDMVEREFAIKWAAQDALYEAMGWALQNPSPPTDNAIYAYAGVFEGDDFENRSASFDPQKLHEFWLWWLTEAIPQAFKEEDLPSGP